MKKIKESFPNIASGDFNFQEVAREDVNKCTKSRNASQIWVNNFNIIQNGMPSVLEIWALKQLVLRGFSSIRSSRSKMFFKIIVFENFENIHWKTPMLKSLLDKGLMGCNWRLQHRCFAVNIAKFLRTAFLQNISDGCFCFLRHL